jgi:hypothetical protein
MLLHNPLWHDVAIACSSKEPPAGTIEVRRGSAVEMLPVATTDLWRYCSDGVVSIVARGSTAFVQGACAQRTDQQFTLSRASDGTAVVTLARRADSTELARALAVRSVDVILERTSPQPSPLSVVVSGRTPLVLDAEALDDLLPDRHKREGVPLRAILSRAGAEAPRTITIRGATTYEVEPAWLATRNLTVRRNQRGQLKFTDETSGVRVSGVTVIDVD